jgi:hypothetical protein
MLLVRDAALPAIAFKLRPCGSVLNKIESLPATELIERLEAMDL